MRFFIAGFVCCHELVIKSTVQALYLLKVDLLEKLRQQPPQAAGQRIEQVLNGDFKWQLKSVFPERILMNELPSLTNITCLFELLIRSGTPPHSRPPLPPPPLHTT